MAAGRILIVDGIATNRVVLKVKLDAAFHVTLTAADGATCLRMAQDQRPDRKLAPVLKPLSRWFCWPMPPMTGCAARHWRRARWM